MPRRGIVGSSDSTMSNSLGLALLCPFCRLSLLYFLKQSTELSFASLSVSYSYICLESFLLILNTLLSYNFMMYLKIKIMWYIYTMEYYSAIKKNEFMKFLGKWLDLEGINLSEVTQSQKNSHDMYSLISGY